MKRGFTLIELLAVIVILAIIAAIATPIILNIIKDTKEAASLRSAEMYLDGVEQAIAKKNMDAEEKFNPKSCLVNENGNLLCDKSTQELIIEVDGEKAIRGNIDFDNGEITEVNLSFGENKTIVKNETGELIFGETVEKTICTLASDSTIKGTEPGAKYNCKVDPNKGTYTFYVLGNNNDGTTNLIMNSNIYSDGTAAGMEAVSSYNNPQKYSLVAWNTGGKNAKGPVTAINFLYEATKNWTNVKPLSYSYKDSESGINSYGYTAFVVDDGIATITSVDGYDTTIGSKAFPLRVRMPLQTELTTKTKAPYLYENVAVSGSLPVGYWTLSSRPNPTGVYVTYYNRIEGNDAASNSSYGVRPVITVKL